MKRPVLLLIAILALLSTSLHAQYTTNYRLGYDAYEQGEYYTALNYFERDLKDNPKSAQSHLMCATIYAKLENYTRTLRSANDAIKYIDKKDKDSKAWAYGLLAYAECAMGDTLQALKSYEKAAKCDPTRKQAYVEQIKIYANQENFEQAYKVCDQLIAANPADEEGYTYYAALYALDKQSEKAIDKATMAIQINPRNPQNYSFRASLFSMAKNYNRAADDVEQYFALGGDGTDMEDVDIPIKECPAIVKKLEGVINRNPQCLGAYYMLYALQQKDGQHLAAARVLGRSFQEIPVLSSAYFIARTLNNAELYDLADEWCDFYLANDTTQNPYPLLLSSEIAHARGDYDKAITAISNYIYATRDAEGYYYRGWIYTNLNRYDDACADYTTCIGLEPDYAYAYMCRGQQYLKLGDRAKAELDFRHVIELEDTLTLPTCLQYAYHYLGNDQRAAEVMQQLLTLIPDAGNYYDAACLYTLMGQTNEALGYLETSLAKGYRNFKHIEEDDDLDALRNTDRFKSAISHYKQVFAQEQQEALSHPELLPPAYEEESDSMALVEEISKEAYAPVGGGSIAIGSVSYNGDSKDGINTDGSEVVLDNAIVEVQAQYPGGEAALLKFIAENLIYPASAVKNGIQGVVVLRFRVEKDGSIGEIRIVKALTPECDQAAAKVIKKLARFKPALQKGKPIPVWFTIPIRFSIQ